jgi:folate-binding protein YgfZ
VLAELTASGAAALSPQEFETLRIEAGLPAADHELTDEYTPLETGLQWTISDKKDRYTGQEVIAQVVAFVCSPPAIMISNQAVLVDGGSTLTE